VGGALRDIAGFGNSLVVSLRWNGLTFVENWHTERTGGYIIDMAVADIDNDGEEEIVAALVFRAGLVKQNSGVYVFELQKY
jgi:hypothetical protein